MRTLVLVHALLACVFLAGCSSGQKSQKEGGKKQAEDRDPISQSVDAPYPPSVLPGGESPAKNPGSEQPQPDRAPKRDAEPEMADVPDDAVPDLAKYQPKYPDSLMFRMERTPCFGQCPVYTVNIYWSGLAVLEGRKFFDYIGTYQTRFSEPEMMDIVRTARDFGYFDFDHVYDAPVTDLPSTLTVINSDEASHWVYNRMNSPEALRQFELEMETRIKDKQWKPYSEPNRD